jgi:hypothetical protein
MTSSSINLRPSAVFHEREKAEQQYEEHDCLVAGIVSSVNSNASAEELTQPGISRDM